MRWLLIVALMAVAACSRSSPSLNGRRVDGNVDSQDVMVLVPDHPSGLLVLYSHGSGGTVTEDIDIGVVRKVTNALLEHGAMVASSEQHVATPRDHRRAAVLPQLLPCWVKSSRRVTRTVLWGASMGALAALSAYDKVHATAMVGSSPVCDIGTVRARFAKAIDEAHGRNPTIPHGRLRFYASPQDPVVPKTRNADVCGGQVVSTHGGHADASNYPPSAITGFLTGV
jgi:hypothetical protein